MTDRMICENYQVVGNVNNCLTLQKLNSVGLDEWIYFQTYQHSDIYLIGFYKNSSIKLPKRQKNKYKYACGLMTKQTHTPTQVMTPTSTPPR